MKVVCDVGDIVNAEFTVIDESAVAPKLSVTRTIAAPEVAGDVYTPVDTFIDPVPLTRE